MAKTKRERVPGVTLLRKRQPKRGTPVEPRGPGKKGTEPPPGWQDVVIAKLRRNEREEIWILLRHYEGHRLIDLRVARRQRDGVWYTTSKGLALRPWVFRDLLIGLEAAVAKVMALGWWEEGDGQTGGAVESHQERGV